MTVTARWPIKGFQSIQVVVDYIQNENKTTDKEPNVDSKTVVEKSVFDRLLGYIGRNQKITEQLQQGRQLISGLNIDDLKDASNEMITHLKKQGVTEDDRTLYHQVQSFHWSDTITPEQAHEIGLRTAREMYPDFQVVVTTHMDRGHLHNHFAICAIAKDGHKLRDDFYGREGLQRLREVSDRISMEYGCYQVKDAPLIGLGGRPKYIDQLMTTSQKKILRTKVDELKSIATDLDELVEMLSNEGHIWNHRAGDSMGFIVPGGKKAVRLASLGEDYSVEDLKRFFKLKRKSYITEENLAQFSVQSLNEITQNGGQAMEQIIESIQYSQKALEPDVEVPVYFRKRARAYSRLQKLDEDLSLLDKYNVQSFEILDTTIQTLEKRLQNKRVQYQQKKQDLTVHQYQLELLKIYLGKYNVAHTYYEMKALSKDLEKSEDVKAFENARQQLGEVDLETARTLYTDYYQKTVELNQMVADLSYDQYELKRLYDIKQGALDRNEEFISSISISQNRIVASMSSEKFYFLRIPYTDEYLYVPKSTVCWNHKDRGCIYLVDDQMQTLFDANGNQTRRLTSEQIKILSDQKKTQIDLNYRKDSTVDSNKLVFTVNHSLFDPDGETNTMVCIRIPNTTGLKFVELPKSNLIWIKENVTAQVVLDRQQKVAVFDKNSGIRQVQDAESLSHNFEPRESEFKALI